MLFSILLRPSLCSSSSSFYSLKFFQFYIWYTMIIDRETHFLWTKKINMIIIWYCRLNVEYSSVYDGPNHVYELMCSIISYYITACLSGAKSIVSRYIMANIIPITRALVFFWISVMINYCHVWFCGAWKSLFPVVCQVHYFVILPQFQSNKHRGKLCLLHQCTQKKEEEDYFSLHKKVWFSSWNWAHDKLCLRLHSF